MRLRIIFKYFLIVIITILFFTDCSESADDSDSNESTDLSGPYFGQKPPGTIPEIFSSDIVSTGFMEHQSPSFNPSGTELYYMINFQISPRPILYTCVEDGYWMPMKVAPFSGCYDDGGVTFTHDGKRLFFHSVRPVNDQLEPKTDSDIWFVERTNEGWSTPINLPSPINTEHSEYMPSISANGTLYFIRSGAGVNGIFYSLYINGKYEEPILMSKSINTENWNAYPFVAPDESYFMFASNRPSGLGSSDIYICYKTEEGEWTEPINLGPTVNSERWDAAPRVTIDGKYLFFCSSRKNDFHDYCITALTYEDVLQRNHSAGNGAGDVFWVSANIIDKLRPKTD